METVKTFEDALKEQELYYKQTDPEGYLIYQKSKKQQKKIKKKLTKLDKIYTNLWRAFYEN